MGRVFDIDHILERDLGGSDELSNLVPLHPDTCHRPKTSARAPVLAKVHRLAKATFGELIEPKGRQLQSRPFPKSTRKLEGRGFAKRRNQHSPTQSGQAARATSIDASAGRK